VNKAAGTHEIGPAPRPLAHHPAVRHRIIRRYREPRP
jgi:hypothetical protein